MYAGAADRREPNPLSATYAPSMYSTARAALNLVVFRKEILKSLEKVSGKGGVEKVF
jgi:hypothetical protein